MVNIKTIVIYNKHRDNTISTSTLPRLAPIDLVSMEGKGIVLCLKTEFVSSSFF